MSPIPTRLSAVVNQDGAAVLDVSRNQITTLNSTGGFIWDGLQQGRTVEQVIDDLAIGSNTDPLVVRGDVIAFLEQLKADDLLQG